MVVWILRLEIFFMICVDKQTVVRSTDTYKIKVFFIVTINLSNLALFTYGSLEHYNLFQNLLENTLIN